jgi:hypothetical protein
VYMHRLCGPGGIVYAFEPVERHVCEVGLCRRRPLIAVQMRTKV